jgi:DNA processing protein
MQRDELSGWLRLTLTPGVGNAAARKLLAAFGLPAQVFAQSLAALSQVVSPLQAAQLRQEPPELAPLLQTTWQWLCSAEAPVRRILVLGDAAYPAGLLNIEDPPLMLYLLGGDGFESNRPEALVPPTYSATDSIANQSSTRFEQRLQASLFLSVAMVGSRNPTAQGVTNAQQFAKALASAGMTVISGLALGVDGAAHQGALDGMPPDGDRLATIAVVGTGLDRVYPRAHRELAHAIARRGLILSEYPLGTPPLAVNFPKRNRLIAGLSQGTLVVEAALKSGSLITARLASEQGKEVFAIPGSIHSVQSRGCHALIRQGAKLVESAQDVLEDMKLDYLSPSGTSNLIANNGDLTGAEGQIDVESGLLTALGFDPVSLDALQARTGLDTPSLQAQLMTLELDGQVARLPGGLFQRMGQA